MKDNIGKKLIELKILNYEVYNLYRLKTPKINYF